MSFERFLGSGIDYSPCHYGASKLAFRGPECDLTHEYLVFLGSTATFGKHVRTPFPTLVGQTLGLGSANLGCVNAGVDTFGMDVTVRGMCRNARGLVVQVMGAHKLSNAYYTVHPRRNDRVIAPTQALRELYPEVDFTEIHFAGHLITTLEAVDKERFSRVRETLQSTWLSRMSDLIGLCGGPVVLVWLSPRPKGAAAETSNDAEPLFVSGPMLHTLAPTRVVAVETTAFACPADPGHRSAQHVSELPGPAVHRRIAAPIADSLGLALGASEWPDR